jgi:predicted transcriptional regulator of viral defense system
MTEAHPRIERQTQLFILADNQAGYFTAHQALELGYAYQYQQHHRQTGAWLEVGRGLFRLRDYPGSDSEELVRLSLWSHNRAGIAQAVVSHATALELYELSDFMPNRKYLTVPPGFRKSPLPGVELHRAILEPSEVETRVGYRITTPLRTLLDLAQTPFNPEHLESAVGQALERGLVRQRKLLEAIEALTDTSKNTQKNMQARDRLLYALLDPKAAPS